MAKKKTKERWVMTIHYLSHLGQKAVATRYFERRSDCELGAREVLMRGTTLVGGDVITIVPPHMIQGITMYPQEEEDASPSS